MTVTLIRARTFLCFLNALAAALRPAFGSASLSVALLPAASARVTFLSLKRLAAPGTVRLPVAAALHDWIGQPTVTAMNLPSFCFLLPPSVNAT